MKHVYQSLTIFELPAAPESEILSQSVVEIESDVTVEPYKDGFSSDLGANGFEVDFD